MRSTKKAVTLFCGLALLLCAAAVYADDDVQDDVDPGVDARVSRISFIRGNAQIRREGSQDWEKAVLNLPVVEGDEIMTDGDGRLEIQLSIYTHIRLAESTYLKVVGLKDGAVALSLSEGTLSARLTKFDKDKGYFEIDAPETTIAIQKAGMYRVDAGRPGASSDVRITVADSGQAHVYSDNSGFTLKNGRSATLKIEGPLAGEWETVDADRYADEFDSWALERDATIAKRLKDAYYDKYYDQDIYGAEDLDDNGQWIYTRKYGYVWRPYRSVTSTYSNWSPYRYGNWRWVPPFGWTWVNDEPWGWATYHHGRWFYDDGYWNWSPYGYVRTSRSWWYPALVGVRIVNQNIYWYPLPTGYGYFNYNQCFGGWGGGRHGNYGGNGGHYGGNGGHNGGNGGNGGPVPTPTPNAYVGPLAGQVGPSVFTNNESRQTWRMTPPLLRVPPGAVVGTTLSSFGRGKAGFGRVSDVDAKVALSKPLGENTQSRILPTYQELDGKVSTAIRVEKPRLVPVTSKSIGATVRPENGGPMDQTLRNTKVFGGRDPIRPESGQGVPVGQTRKIGAIARDPIRTGDAPIKPEPAPRETKPLRNNDAPIRVEPPPRQVKRRDGRMDEPVRVEPIRQPETKRQRDPRGDDPIRVAPTRAPETKTERQPPIRQPRYEPPPRSAPVRSEPVRSAPVRSEPQPSKSISTRNAPANSEPSRSKSGSDRPAPTENRKRDH